MDTARNWNTFTEILLEIEQIFILNSDCPQKKMQFC